MIDLRQSKNYADYLSRDGWIVERNNDINYFIKKVPILGYIIKIQRPQVIRYKDIEILSKKYNPYQISIEPNLAISVTKKYHDLLLHNGYKLSKSPFLPTKTLQIDLTQSLTAIEKKFKRNIKKGILVGKGLKIKNYSTPKDIKIFRESWKKSVKYSRYVPSLESLLNLKKSFTCRSGKNPENKSLFLASHNITGSIIGGVIFTITSHERSNYIVSYMYGFTSNEGRSTLSHASLLHQGILWGKKMGCKVFDFEGIYDPRFPNTSWRGFTQFKKSFGGYEVSYPGCYVKFYLNNIFHRSQ